LDFFIALYTFIMCDCQFPAFFVPERFFWVRRRAVRGIYI